ncbi:MAG: metalloregulator ArsR/SmtB family transcription factor [Candidatus Micrarchaeia archaeon]
MNKLAKLFSVLSDPVRLQIIMCLMESKGCVTDLQKKLGKKQPNISQHLRILRDANLVSYQRDGKKICYSIKNDKIKKIFEMANEICNEGA